MASPLSTGSCARLHAAQIGDNAALDEPHTLQFLSIKKVTPAPTANAPIVDRYRIIISDGVNFVQAMLATQLNHLVDNNTIGKNTIALIDKLTCNYVQEKRLFIILSLKVLQASAEKVGSPEALKSDAPSAVSPAPAVASTSTAVAAAAPPQQQRQQAANRSRQGPGQSGLPKANIYPIEGLSPYQNNWMIKARVTQKSDVKEWSNARGEGKLFNVTFMDESGEIKGTAFNTGVDVLYDQFQEGKVYYVSKARVNLAKKKFSNLANDYELSLEATTHVEECVEATDVPMVKFNFIELNKLEEVQKDSTCDVIAIVKDIGEVGDIVSKTTQKTITKRELTLVDKSLFSVKLTLWGKQAETFNTPQGTVIAFKGVKVSDFGGRSLSMFSGSTMTPDPDIAETFKLRGWYDTFGVAEKYQSHSNNMSGGGGAGFNRAEVRNLCDVKDSQLGMSDKVEYFSCRATIMHIKPENISYPACPSDNCNKKVVEDNSGQWRCEKCEKTFDAPEHRYLLSFAVSDWSAQAWLQGFNEVGQAIFDKTANEVVAMRENDEQQFNALMANANCNTFNFSCRAKQDTYNEQTRVRYGIQKIAKLNFLEEAHALRDLLHSDWAA